MPEKRIYQPVPGFTTEEIKSAIQEDNVELLKEIAYAVGYHSTDWKYSQDICIQLSAHPNKAVREMSILGLFYVALFQKKLDKRLVKPVFLRALRDPEVEVRERAGDLLPEINWKLNWNIANYHKKEKTTGIEENEEESFSRKRHDKL